jgi:hypothetical protein
MGFADEVRAFAQKSPAAAAMVHKKIALELFSRVIMRTPVDTGRLRGNWQAAVNVFAPGTLGDLDPSGGGAIAAATATVTGAAPFATLTLTNNLPYAARIEYDNWSQKAPAGMVRVSVAEFQGIARDAGLSIG